MTEPDCAAAALEAEALFRATSPTTTLAPTLERPAQQNPATLALMHGASFTGDGAGQVRGLADGFAAMAARTRVIALRLSSPIRKIYCAPWLFKLLYTSPGGKHKRAKENNGLCQHRGSLAGLGMQRSQVALCW
ncbi:hypothetical protein [Mycobacterium palustre]|uniref:hypothetical protein n=1 Tax=Mycobacterium palustre TaxID=153971 RepID=UPI001FED14CB|nr:hypothetical protein [Mycobacterium palustre]